MIDGISAPLPLWEHQNKIIEQASEIFRHHRSLLVTAPTGSGKTVTFSEIIARALVKNLRVGVLVHRQELVKQSESAILLRSGVKPGVIWQGRKEWDSPVTIMAQDTVMNLDLTPLQGLDILVTDEAHHIVAPTWLNTVKRINPRYLLGFSATPFRQDREPLVPEPFAKVIRPITPKELIDQGILCPAVIESPIIHDQNGDPQPINKASNIENIYHQAIRYAIGNGRTKILLYVSQTQEYTPLQVIERTVKLLRRVGITADGVYKNMSPAKREAAIKRFMNSGSASVLLNYMAMTEGTDLPYVDCIIIGRHTQSESTIIQMIGRGLRLHPQKKDCLVIEYTQRPDMDDIIHYWRLDEPVLDGGSSPKNRKNNQTLLELTQLATKFPRRLSTLDAARIQYPWFKPFKGRPLMALPLWSEEDGAARYITVEPQKAGTWRVSKVTLNNRGLTPLTRQQTSVETPEEAANLVRIALGVNAPQLQRNANWRVKTASPAQMGTYWSLHPNESRKEMTMSAGEVSDEIAQQRFQRRVDSKTI